MFITLVLFIIFIVLVGKICLSFTQLTFKNKLTSLFTYSVVGFYLSISVFAIIKSKGISISSLLVLLTILWGVSSKIFQKPNLKSFRFEWKELFEFLIIVSGLYLFNSWKYTLPDETIAVVNWDALSDVTRAIFLNHTGVENSNTNFIQIPTGSQPYHYFEAWAVAFFGSISDSNFWLSQNLIFQPIILGICFLGFRSLSNKKAGNIGAIIFGVLLLFSSGFLNEFIHKIPFFEWTIPLKNNIIDEPWWTRMAVLYPIIIMSIHFFIRQDYKNAMVGILFIPFLSVTPAIPVIFACMTTIFFILLFIKQHNLKWIHLLVPIVVGISYKLFYTFFLDPSDFIPLPTIKEIVVEITQPSILKSKIIIIVEKIIQTGILYSPIIVMILAGLFFTKSLNLNFTKWNEINKIGTVFISTITLGSLIMWQVLNFVFGASFFYYYTMIPFFNIVLILILWNVYLKSKFKVIPLLVVFLFLGFYFNRSHKIHANSIATYFTNRYDSNFIKKINEIWKEKIADHGLALGVKLENHSEIAHPFFNDGISLCGYYMYGIAKSPALVSLSRADLPDDKLNATPYSESFTKNSSFYQYVESKKNDISIAEHKKNFILDYKIKYGIVSPKGEIPSNFVPIIETVITDTISGERFILFK